MVSTASQLACILCHELSLVYRNTPAAREDRQPPGSLELSTALHSVAGKFEERRVLGKSPSSNFHVLFQKKVGKNAMCLGCFEKTHSESVDKLYTWQRSIGVLGHGETNYTTSCNSQKYIV